MARRADTPARPTPASTANALVKAAFLVLMGVVVLFPDLEGFAGKAPLVRALTYPLAALVVPAGWWLRGRRPPYPHWADAFVALPFVVDLAGNVLDLYDRIDWWDDANHFWNWALLCLGVGLLLRRSSRIADRAVLAGLVGGFGGLAIIFWEVGEYWAFIRTSSELDTAYTDTLGDLVLSSLGGIAAGILLGTCLWTWSGRTAARRVPAQASGSRSVEENTTFVSAASASVPASPDAANPAISR